MLIADILRTKGAGVKSVAASASLKDAINSLADMRIGALVVSEDGRTIDGIISERDIVKALAQEVIQLDSQTVADLMTRDVYTCAPESTVASVMELMDEQRIRHVPVTVNSVLAGVVSIRDIVAARLMETETERKEMADYIAGTPA